MKILNIHKRKINVPKEKVLMLLSTLATENDGVWPKEKWPKMKFKKGLKKGSEGGHGPIRYKVKDYNPMSHIVFEFQSPEEFKGFHKFEVSALDSSNTEIMHTIDMQTSGLGIIKWGLAVRWLHDALLEDAFDKVQNRLTSSKEITKWNPWVRFLRTLLK